MSNNPLNTTTIIPSSFRQEEGEDRTDNDDISSSSSSSPRALGGTSKDYYCDTQRQQLTMQQLRGQRLARLGITPNKKDDHQKPSVPTAEAAVSKPPDEKTISSSEQCHDANTVEQVEQIEDEEIENEDEDYEYEYDYDDDDAGD